MKMSLPYFIHPRGLAPEMFPCCCRGGIPQEHPLPSLEGLGKALAPSRARIHELQGSVEFRLDPLWYRRLGWKDPDWISLGQGAGMEKSRLDLPGTGCWDGGIPAGSSLAQGAGMEESQLDPPGTPCPAQGGSSALPSPLAFPRFPPTVASQGKPLQNSLPSTLPGLMWVSPDLGESWDDVGWEGP